MEEKKENKPKTTVEVIESGPLKISGFIILKDLQRDKETTMSEVRLCRCGKSSNKPFCDESHKNK
jgi:CDGSH iron-sulfur domain-containing protein 3